MLDSLGLSHERLEQSGELEKMLNWQKSNLVSIAIPIGDTTIYTEARLAFRTDNEGNIGLAIHAMRKEPQRDYPYMGYKFSPEEKEQLLATGNLGKTIEVTPKSGEPFAAYVSIDPQTNEIIALRADRVSIPQEIKGVILSDQQYKDLVEGKAVKVEGMTAKSGKSFDATLQVNAEKKGIEFIFGENKSLKERQEQRQDRQQSKAPRKLCGLELSEKQRNKAISPIRSTIERTFSSIRRWFHGGRCRYRGLAKTHTQNILKSIAFNLYRTPGIIMSSCIG